MHHAGRTWQLAISRASANRKGIAARTADSKRSRGAQQRSDMLKACFCALARRRRSLRRRCCRARRRFARRRWAKLTLQHLIPIESAQRVVQHHADNHDNAGQRTDQSRALPAVVALIAAPLDANLPDSSCILVIPASAASSVDFTHASLGLQWQNCFQP